MSMSRMSRMSTTSILEYGYVIKFVSSNPIYEGKYFFIDRLYDDKLIILSDKETITLGITDETLDDKSIEKIIIVYKPKQGQGFIFQHKLFLGQFIEIEFEDVKVIGKITNTLKDKIIQVETEPTSNDSPITLYIPLDRGLPKQIISIKIHVKEGRERKREGEREEATGEDEEGATGEDKEFEDGLLNVVEEDIEEQDQFYYSIEQQKNDFLENLLMYIPVEQRTPKKLKELNKMIKRYIELRTKYTTFSDGVYINYLQYEQILATTIGLENKLYVPVTKGVHVKLSNPSEFEGMKENFFKETDIDDEWKKDFSDLKESVSFTKQLDLIHNFDNLIYHSKPNANQIKTKPKNMLAYILGKTEYPLMITKPFIVDSFIGHPNFFIDYSKLVLNRSFLMEKSDLSLRPYYPSMYRIDEGKFCENANRVYYKNENDTFEKYVKKMIPTMNEFIECVNKPFVNMVDVLKELNILEINELNASNYLLVNEIIKKNVNKIKQNFIKTAPSYLTKPNKDKIISSQMNDDILTEYKNLSKLASSKKYFSNSEIFKMAEVDLYRLLAFHYSIRNAALYHSTDAEIQAIIAEIKQEKDTPLQRKIHKKYYSKEEKDRDNFKPIIIRDTEIEDEPEVFKSTLDILYEELIKTQTANATIQITQSLEHFKDKIAILLDNGLNNIDGLFSPSAFKIIREFIIKNKIVNGDIAVLNDELYVWKDKWVEYKDEPVTKKLVTVKGELDPSKKEEMYTKRIHQLLVDIENDKVRVKEIKDALNEENKVEMKIMIQTFIKQNLSKELKYNNEKLFLEKEELGDKGIIVSPHEHVRDKILQVYELDIKYKALQIFIERYCKNARDPNWYYCIDTGVKLLPTFFNDMATAYLITHNYEDTLEKICLDRGALSDSGDKWVDKYSGYIIKNIEFDYDEGYTETGFKNISRSQIEGPELPAREEDPIMNSIKALIKYAGLADVGDDIEWIHSYVMQSHDTAMRVNKSAAKAQYILYVISIISVILVYVQTLERISFIKAFPNCKVSFSGYPLEDGDGGIKYLCCIVSKMNKPDLPFSSVARTKSEDLEKNVHDFIKKFLLTNLEIEDKLKERRLHKRVEDVSHYTPWNLFLPRLKPFIPSVFEDVGSLEDKMYCLSFELQYKIHRFVSTQPPILMNHNQMPYLVNTCCNEDNNTHHYFVKKDPTIADVLKRIYDLSKKNKVIQHLLKHPIVYSYANTKKVSIPISSQLDEVTLFTGLIQLFNFDNALPIPFTLAMFDIEKPGEYYNKNDDIKLKIRKLKEHGYDITEETLYKMLQSSATIVRNTLKQGPPDKPIDDPIMAFFDTKEIKNKAFEMLMKKKEECMKYLDAKDKYYESVLTMDFKKDKRSSTIPVEIEHFTYMYQVLYNKIQSFINFSEMVISKKDKPDTYVCKHWKLSSFHYNDIAGFVKSYYNGIGGFFKNKELSDALLQLPLDKYKSMLNLQIKDPETKYLVYHYIFVSIYQLYLSSKSKSIKLYLDSITKLFAHENKRALNFDLKTIKYEIKLSKKNEAEIKTTYLGKLQYDERASENVMKNLKLGKWGVGLQKSMFEYNKDTYLQDKTDADEVIAMGTAELDAELDADAELAGNGEEGEVNEYAAFMPEDDDYVEGFDGDELY